MTSMYCRPHIHASFFFLENNTIVTALLKGVSYIVSSYKRAPTKGGVSTECCITKIHQGGEGIKDESIVFSTLINDLNYMIHSSLIYSCRSFASPHIR